MYNYLCTKQLLSLFRIGGIQTIQFNQIVFKLENRADVFQLSTFNYFPINLGSTREQGPYLTSNFRLAGLLTVGIFLSNSLFLIAILHRDLRNCFVFSISVHLLSIFYLDFYFSFLFGLSFSHSCLDFQFSLFYLDFYFFLGLFFLLGLLFLI